jgi:hypothetical protein
VRVVDVVELEYDVTVEVVDLLVEVVVDAVLV